VPIEITGAVEPTRRRMAGQRLLVRCGMTLGGMPRRQIGTTTELANVPSSCRRLTGANGEARARTTFTYRRK